MCERVNSRLNPDYLIHLRMWVEPRLNPEIAMKHLRVNSWLELNQSGLHSIYTTTKMSTSHSDLMGLFVVCMAMRSGHSLCHLGWVSPDYPCILGNYKEIWAISPSHRAKGWYGSYHTCPRQPLSPITVEQQLVQKCKWKQLSIWKTSW